jgi:septal ring factor EnvC (AmiA/AmiB activator)
MAKEKKVHVRDTPKYTTSSDALNENDRLLEKQEDILYEEHDKFISVQKSLALEIKRNEMLSSELSACHESVSSLKNLNDDLNAKLKKLVKQVHV